MKPGQWRPWVAINLMAHQGIRASAVLHLRWSDVDLVTGLINWPASWDKMGRQWVQPIRGGTMKSFEVADAMRRKHQYIASGSFLAPGLSS